MSIQIRDDLAVAYGTLRGPVRPENQDDFLIYEARDKAEAGAGERLFAIADGMGGEAGGAQASRAALRAFFVAWLEAKGRPPRDRLQAGMAAAYQALREEVKTDPSLRKMGTTLTAVQILPDLAHGIHVGDSRCLKFGKGGALWITDLHQDREQTNTLTRAVRAEGDPSEAQVFETSLQVGEGLALCTDGLWRSRDESEWAAYRAPGPLEDKARDLFLDSVRRLGDDNATLILLRRDKPNLGTPREVPELDTESKTVFGKPRTKPLLERLLPLLLLLLGLLLWYLALHPK
ncbi:MAG TPA: serine/threonine-protein phosphatase [Planctomycetes bacterium]|nr:serine/threonine-protein phosphatase [Planctomycetota bacterium]